MRTKKFNIIDGQKHYQCNKCKEFKSTDYFFLDNRSPIKITSYCKPCHTKYSIEKRDRVNSNKINKEYSKRRRKNNTEIVREYEKQASRKREKNIKTKARAILNNAVRDGRIIKPIICECCNEDKRLTGHHEDYSKPLEVKWLCYECHAKEHSND